jgi:hypothetical protein
MSALPPKADIRTKPRNVRYVPKADIGSDLSREPGGDLALRWSQPILSLTRRRSAFGDWKLMQPSQHWLPFGVL